MTVGISVIYDQPDFPVKVLYSGTVHDLSKRNQIIFTAKTSFALQHWIFGLFPSQKQTFVTSDTNQMSLATYVLLVLICGHIQRRSKAKRKETTITKKITITL